MPGIRRDVDRDRSDSSSRANSRGEIRSAAILPDDDRRHALADHRERVARGVEAAVVVAVRVDEAGREREAVGIDHAFALDRGEIGRRRQCGRRRCERRRAGTARRAVIICARRMSSRRLRPAVRRTPTMAAAIGARAMAQAMRWRCIIAILSVLAKRQVEAPGQCELGRRRVRAESATRRDSAGARVRRRRRRRPTASERVSTGSRRRRPPKRNRAVSPSETDTTGSPAAIDRSLSSLSWCSAHAARRHRSS